jgi:Sulfatase-modifying factor enzyme 1
MKNSAIGRRSVTMRAPRLPVAAFALVLAASCHHESDAPILPAPTSPAPPAGEATDPRPAEQEVASTTSDSASAVKPEPDDHCPSDMVYVSTNYCRNVERKCLHYEPIYSQHLTICHAFEHDSTVCKGGAEEKHYCIDKYEYPNVEGGHPTWMVMWYDAQSTCEAKGKRLCYESEWTAACEGPDHTPFPYGWERDNTACNIDNQFIIPSIPDITSHDPKVKLAGLERLDQSVPSGSLKRCVSGFGAYDMTGNFDEWVTRDEPTDYRGPTDISKWAGLKGGGWGHVRNACRPMTVGHDPGFAWYSIAFRCCADAKGYPPYKPKNILPPPHVEPNDTAPIPPVHLENAPGPSAEKVPMDRFY